MARFDKIAVLNKIGSTGMVPVFYHKDAEVAKKVWIELVLQGGVTGCVIFFLKFGSFLLQF